MRLTYRPFKRDGEQFLSLDGKLHRQFLQHLLRIAIDDVTACVSPGLITRSMPFQYLFVADTGVQIAYF